MLSLGYHNVRSKLGCRVDPRGADVSIVLWNRVVSNYLVDRNEITGWSDPKGSRSVVRTL